ncbi:hypothetical protein SAY87_018651 [Trapa incisa]|uniref:EGF-like domain-containing protein n=1 Tax=Trapa incisa TaxID=236973 RepID=A0AAN7JYI5_9MYRT|nr:hypothetical protein SAY87_018651 [Trapa incisa]
MTGRTTAPVIVEWSIPGLACDEAQQDSATYACRENTICTDVLSGYRCQCKKGYTGNPYLPGENGCQGLSPARELRPRVSETILPCVKSENRGLHGS